MGVISEFKAFALKGNVVDMAVGVIIGGAFGAIVTSLVNNVLMPVIGLATGGVDFKDKKLILKEGVPAGVDAATNAAIPAVPEVALSWGLFVNAVIQFLIVAFALFMLIKAMNTAMERMKRKEAAAAAPPPGPTKDQALLMEIRDLLAARR